MLIPVLPLADRSAANFNPRIRSFRQRMARTVVVAAASATFAAIGCAKVTTGGATTGGNNGGGLISGSGGTTVSGTGNSSGGTGSTSGTGGSLMSSGSDGGICQQAQYKFEPKIPTVFMLVDRSGSMFDCISTVGNVEPSCATPADTSWTKLKTATLALVDSLQTQVRFGFASFTGTNPTGGGTCPILDKVPPALNNSTAIATKYNSLAFQPNTTQVGMKFETPARQSLDLIGADLIADTSPGEKYILFVTDGQPDYCDDSNSLCAPDSVIAGLQDLKTKGITTIVIGLQSAVNDLAPGILQAFANAGAGESTVAPLKTGTDTFAFYDQCNSIAGWHGDLITSGKTAARGVTLGTYATAAGPTKPYTPDAANQAMLMTQLSQALSGVKSCTFDMNNVDGKALKVNLQLLAKAHVLMDGKEIPLDDTNGWKMATQSQLELTGAACDNWRNPSAVKMDFQFPCEIIIPE